MYFPSGVLLLRDFLPSSEGSKPFHLAAPWLPWLRWKGEKRERGKKAFLLWTSSASPLCPGLCGEQPHATGWDVVQLCPQEEETNLTSITQVCTALLRIRRMFGSKLKAELQKETNQQRKKKKENKTGQPWAHIWKVLMEILSNLI